MLLLHYSFAYNNTYFNTVRTTESKIVFMVPQIKFDQIYLYRKSFFKTDPGKKFSHDMTSSVKSMFKWIFIPFTFFLKIPGKIKLIFFLLCTFGTIKFTVYSFEDLLLRGKGVSTLRIEINLIIKKREVYALIINFIVFG